VELEPEIQSTFLDAAGRAARGRRIGDELETRTRTPTAVRRGAEAVLARHGADGAHYLRTLARYNAEAWPGIGAVVATLEG
jgi:hypothetical protein